MLTCVSCYFPVKNKHDNKYLKWFENTLSINCPYVFFTNSKSIDIIKKYRKDLPTYYIDCEIEDFFTYKYRNRMITHEIHCPSIELNLIWNEKIFMIQKAYEINPFDSEWFQWIDAGICSYRDEKPPSITYPNINKLSLLSKDKFIYSASYEYNSNLVTKTNYYHHISGTSYLIHKSLINRFVDIYQLYLEKLVDKDNIWTDQLLLTHIHKDNPDMFLKFCNGYGEIVKYLFT